VINLNLKEQTSSVLKTLTPREEKVIKMRFGLDDGSEHTLEEVASRSRYPRTHPADRGEGAAQVAAPVSFAQAARILGRPLARLPVEGSELENRPLKKKRPEFVGALFCLLRRTNYSAALANCRGRCRRRTSRHHIGDGIAGVINEVAASVHRKSLCFPGGIQEIGNSQRKRIHLEVRGHLMNKSQKILGAIILLCWPFPFMDSGFRDPEAAREEPSPRNQRTPTPQWWTYRRSK